MLEDEAKAREFVSQIEETVENKFESKQTILTTKEDLANLKGDLRADIRDSKVEIIRWVFVF